MQPNKIDYRDVRVTPDGGAEIVLLDSINSVIYQDPDDKTWRVQFPMSKVQAEDVGIGPEWSSARRDKKYFHWRFSFRMEENVRQSIDKQAACYAY